MNGCLTLFIQEQFAKGNSERTITYYTDCLDCFASFAGKPLDNITRDDILNWLFSLRQKGLSPNSVQTYFRGIRAFYNWMYARKYIDINPVSDISNPKSLKRVVRVLTDSEIKTLLCAYKTQIEHIAVTVLLDTGIRSAELLRLRPCDFDFDNHFVKVLGKGNKERFVPITQTSIDVVSRLAPLANIVPLSASGLKTMFQRLKRKAGIPRLHAHLLRHTFATNWVMSGGDLFTLQVVLGHSSLDVTRRYSHIAVQTAIMNGRTFSPLK